MTDRRRKNADWYVAGKDGNTLGWAPRQLAVLMDIRDELQSLVWKMERAGAALRAIHAQGMRHKPRITVKQAARIMAKRRNRRDK